MNFSDYIIDKSDYNFFMSLDSDEKLLFIYDLVCDQIYGPGSIEEFDSNIVKQDITNQIQLKLESIIESSINEKALVNILIINNKIILNSKSIILITDAVADLYVRGYLLSAVELTKKQSETFHQQKYCKVYNIIGKLPPITQN